MSFFRKFFQLKSRDQLQADDEKASSGEMLADQICDVAPRQRVRVSGTLRSITYPPQGRSMDLSGILFDGTGSIELVWMGRRDISALRPGARMVARGMVSGSAEHKRIINPNFDVITRSR
ncbi:MAG: OB-fold nucleic acid binding domain-containing protein [Actinomycetaceae bacterium]|nr:OB-fold nucleic acid binding domain-containing protein [Actinomycetaceae bacterium]